MRLIHADIFCLKEYFDDSIPPYSILSYTYGADEISLQAFQRPDRRVIHLDHARIVAAAPLLSLSLASAIALRV
ncbi:hypothetical protein MN608_08795 [Microdochium nivale]|nr:hypothetical protein MN608_08795 [Microdochium nivale]